MADNHVGLNNLVDNYEFQENAQKFGFVEWVFLEVLRIFTTEKSTAFWIIISQIILRLPWNRLSTPRAGGSRVAEPEPAEPNEADEPEAELPNENHEETFIEFPQDPSRNVNIKTTINPGELSKRLRVTPKGGIQLDTESGSEKTTTMRRPSRNRRT